MKVLKMLVAAVLVSHFAWAQVDPKAQEILKSVSAKYKSYKTVSAKFKISVVDQKNKSTENQTGTLLLKGPMYKVVMGSQEIISDGKVIWTYLKDANEVQINDPKSDPNSISPNNIFTMYETGFKSKYNGEKTIGGKQMQIVELVPEDAKRNFSRVKLVINKSEKYISEATIYQKSGTNLTYNVLEFKPNVAADESVFMFNKANYPGVEEVDLRN